MTEKQSPEIEKELKPSSKTHKSHQITQKMYKEAIEDSLGTVTDVARRLDVTHGAVCHYLESHPKIKELLIKKRLSNVDRAEDEIFQQLKFEDYEKEPATAAKIRQSAAQYITSRLGKHEGWVEKQEVQHSGKIDNKMEVEIIQINKDEDSDDGGVQEYGASVSS